MLKKWPLFEKKVIQRPLLAINSEEEERTINRRNYSYAFFLKSLDCIRYVSNMIACFFLTLVPSSFSGFGAIPIWLSIVLTLFLAFGIFAIYLNVIESAKAKKLEDGVTKPNSFGKNLSYAYNKNPVFVGIVCGMLALFAFIVPLATENTCLCFYNSDYGFEVNPLAVMSTRMTRAISLDPACPMGKPCHVYATLPEDPAHYVFINVHTNHAVTNLTIFYGKLEDYQKNKVLTQHSQSMYYPIDIEPAGRRTVHTVLLEDLEPSTTYYYEIFYNNQTWYNGTYKTLPDQGDEPVTIVIGGDVGSSATAVDLTSNLSKISPDVLIIGGDAAYDNGLHNCWHSWDLFLKMYEDLSDSVGRTLPIIVGVGNHDVGFHAHANVTIPTDDIPYYFYFLPQHFAQDSEGNVIHDIPDVENRRTYFYHKIGNSIWFGLDSAYLNDFNGTQVDYMLNNTHLAPGRFAYYHVPTYPSCLGDTNNTPEVRGRAEDSWAPVFENYNFSGIFENHVHMLKKTKKIKDGVVSEDGVVYYGDGNWGIVPTFCEPELLGNTELMEVYNSINHVWVVKIENTRFEIYPVGVTAEQIYQSTTGNF
jgi:Phosphodiesterase/alkaline phosphatase D